MDRRSLITSALAVPATPAVPAVPAVLDDASRGGAVQRAGGGIWLEKRSDTSLRV